MFADKIASAPSGKDFNYYLDYIELLVLTSLDKHLSVTDIYQRFVTDKLGQIEHISTQAELEGTSTEAETVDYKNLQLNELFKLYLSRIALFTGHKYPFELNQIGENYSLKLKDTINEEQKLYIYLLLCSNLSYTKEDMNDLTTHFEIVCIPSLKKLFPNSGSERIIYCGKGNALDTSIFPSAHAYDKLGEIASLLNVRINSNCQRRDFHGSSGDAGIDLLGYIKQEDSQPGTQLTFAQCACGKDFIDKQLEAHQVETNSKFDISFNHTTLLFTPRSFRDEENKWFTTYKQKSIYYDRYRILKNTCYQELDAIQQNEIDSKFDKYRGLSINV